MTAAQEAKAFAAAVTKKVACRYLLHLPKGYERGRKRWPLLLFLHGAGERGADLERVKKHGIARVVEEGMKLPFIAVSPQCPADSWWTEQTQVLLALLDELIVRYRVDTRRIYLTGLSMGGFGTWMLGTSAPERFAALAPVCGGGSRLHGFPQRIADMVNTPVWAFHGAKDPVVPLSESQVLVDALRAAGGNVQFTVYPEADHDSWTETYANPALYAWFLSHELGEQV